MEYMLDGEELIGTLYKQNDVIFNQGEPGDSLYLIQSGTVSIYHDTKDHRSELCTLAKGDFIGEIALVNGMANRCTTAQVTDDARLIRVSKAALLRKIQADPDVALHLLRNLLSRLQQSRQRIHNLVADNDALQEVLQENCNEFFLNRHKLYSRLGRKCHLNGTDSLRFLLQPNQQIKIREILKNQIALITEGYAELCLTESGGTLPYSLAGPGDIVGNTSSLLENWNSDKIKAKTRLQIQSISYNDLVERMRAEPSFSRHLLESAISRLRFQNSALATPEKAASTVRKNSVFFAPDPVRKKLTIAIITLSTCSGCSSTWLEKDFLDELHEDYKIVYCPFIMDRKDIPAADIALVDGVVRLNEDLKRLEMARNRSRLLVAWGTCACLGGIPAMANRFEVEELIEETYGSAHDTLAYFLNGKAGVDHASTYQQKSLGLQRKARKINEFVRVDFSLPGCPPPLNMLQELLREMKGSESKKAKPVVCSECRKRKINGSVQSFRSFSHGQKNGKACMISQGTLCLGFMTRGGCNALCTKNNFPCWGCRGVSKQAHQAILKGDTYSEVLSKGLGKRTGTDENDLSCVLKTLRKLDYGLMNFGYEGGSKKQLEW